MIGYCFCGSFCTVEKSLKVLRSLAAEGNDILPVMNDSVYFDDTRFGKAEDIRSAVQNICGREIIHTVVGAEPIGPSIKLDMLVIAPCTGNTLAKMAMGITDSAVTMAAKAQLRADRPVVIALATNDALSSNLKTSARCFSGKTYILCLWRRMIRKRNLIRLSATLICLKAQWFPLLLADSFSLCFWVR